MRIEPYRYWYIPFILGLVGISLVWFFSNGWVAFGLILFGLSMGYKETEI